MARKQAVTIQDIADTNEDFEEYIESHKHVLICVEVYSGFCGSCAATNQAIRKGKLEMGGERIAMLKHGKLTRAMFGPNGIELCRIIEEELALCKKEEDGLPVHRTMLEISEMLPEEAEKQKAALKVAEEMREASERLRVLTLAARKKRVNTRLSQSVPHLNYIMFWPHCHQAHYDLYEKWDIINIQVGAKETFQLKEEDVKEVLYMSDVVPNEACVHALLAGEVLVVLFKMFDTDTRNFVKLMRYALYEEIPVPKEDVPPEKQVPPIPAYERYATISKSAREVRRDRYNAKLQKIREEQEDADRLASEQARIQREQEEEIAMQEKKRLEDERMARIAAGLPADPEPEPGVEGEVEEEATAAVSTEAMEGEAEEVEEEHKVEEEVFNSDVEVEDEEYIPPGGQFVPGLYSPPNELAKANGLAFFYPKQVRDLATIETEYLPHHVLVIFTADKRNEVMEIVKAYRDEILNMGFFVGDDPHTAEHIAYTFKQYEKMTRLRRHLDRLALMVSRKRSLPLLQLAGANPIYISADVESGEKECLTLFPVGYGDDYEDEESVEEEEVQVIPEAPEPEPEAPEAPVEKNEDDEDADDEG